MKKLFTTLSLMLAVLIGGTGVSFALPPCPAERNSLYSPWSNCFGTYTFPSGNKYVGEYKNDKRNGQGTFTFPKSGNKYVGEFKNDKRNGQGTFTCDSGSKYIGEWKDDKRNGQGTSTFGSGDKHVGEFKDNKRNGQGTFYYLGDD